MAVAISGQASFRAAMVAGALNVVSELAQTWAAYYLALSIADWFWNPPRAAEELAAAIALEAVSGLAADRAAPIGSSGSPTGSSPSAPANLPPTPATTANPSPAAGANVPHLGLGGLVSSRTLAIVGDSMRAGGNAREAIIPLDDERAKGTIGAEIADYVVEKMGPGGSTIHLHLHGNLISPDKLPKVMREMTRQVNRGQDRLSSSNSFRVTKKG